MKPLYFVPPDQWTSSLTEGARGSGLAINDQLPDGLVWDLSYLVRFSSLSLAGLTSRGYCPFPKILIKPLLIET